MSLQLYFVYAVILLFPNFYCWNVTVEVNPDCKNCSKDSVSLVYVRAENASCSYHYVFDASSVFTPPSLVSWYSNSRSARLAIDWESIWQNTTKDRSHAIVLDGASDSNAFIILQLLEYNDIDMKANCTAYSPIDRKIANQKFTLVSYDKYFDPKSGLLQIAFNSSEGLLFNVMFSNRDQVSPLMPSLFFHAGFSVHFEFGLNAVKTTWPSSRFILRYAFVANHSMNTTDDFKARYHFDMTDERAPGVFKTSYALLNERENETGGEKWGVDAYFHWKSVAYVSRERSLRTQCSVLAPPRSQLAKNLKEIQYFFSVVYAVYGERFSRNSKINNIASIRTQDFCFGDPDDGFYMKNKFLLWTMGLGYGEPVDPGMSSATLVFIIISVSIPALLLLVAVVSLLVKRSRMAVTHRPLIAQEHFEENSIGYDD